MIYGMYLSATGLVTNSHQQDVIANNLANAETPGFKRQLEIQTQRQVESKVAHASGNDLLDQIGGGQLAAPSYTDFSQGELEDTGNNFDAAIFGKGFMAVQDGDQTRLTRSGSLMLDKDGNLINNLGQNVLDTNKNPIKISGFRQGELRIETNGTIKNRQDTVAQIGMFEPSDVQSLKPLGKNMFGMTAGTKLTAATGAALHHNMIEHANVDPTTELTRLMQSQRELEANANMIRYQDQSLARAVNDVGKIS